MKEEIRRGEGEAMVVNGFLCSCVQCAYVGIVTDRGLTCTVHL